MFTKPLVAKIAIGLLGAGGLGALGYQGYQMFSKEKEETTIEKVSNKDKLENEKYLPLTDDSTNEAHWNAILNSYKEASESLRFENFNGQEPTGGAPKAVVTLKAKCKEALESDVPSLLTKARKWCVTPVKAFALLNSRGSKVLKTEENKPDDEKAEWKKRIAAFEEAKKSKQDLGTLIVLQVGETHEATNIVAMKKKCKEFGDTESHSKDFEKNLENLDNWCVDKP